MRTVNQMENLELFKRHPSIKIIAAWFLYGAGTSMILNFLFPNFLTGNWHEAIYLAIFLLLGVLDYVASSISYKKQRSVKLV